MKRRNYYVHYINNIHILLFVYLFKQYCKEKTQGRTRLGMCGHGHQSDTEFVWIFGTNAKFIQAQWLFKRRAFPGFVVNTCQGLPEQIAQCPCRSNPTKVIVCKTKNCTNKKCQKSWDPFPSPTLLPVDLDAPLASRAFLSASTLPPPPPPPEPPPMPPPAPPPPPFCCSSISSGWLRSVTCCRLQAQTACSWAVQASVGSTENCRKFKLLP